MGTDPGSRLSGASPAVGEVRNTGVRAIVHTLPSGQPEERSCSFVWPAGRAIVGVVFVVRVILVGLELLKFPRPQSSIRQPPQFHQRGAVARSPG